MHIRKLVVLAIAFIFFSTGCTTVKPYQKQYLNDEEMALTTKKIEAYEQNMEVYREGASGANGGNVSGGCGCN